MIIVIPAYQPDEKLKGVVNELIEKTDYPVLIVDDGSRESCMPLFEQLAAMPRVIVLHHEVNKGKGAAMKTAFAYIKDNMPEQEGLVTVDADGQHLLPDTVRVAEAVKEHPGALLLGSRRFTGKVPFKSKAGNAITRFVFAVSTGVKVFDTQTGLRGFSTDLIPQMLSLEGDRYEYEINQLLYCTKEQIPIVELPIETVYIEDNASSHFHPFRDSWRIYKRIFMFISSSLASFLLEYVLFLLLELFTRNAALPASFVLLITSGVPRILSSIFNFMYNKKLVFDASCPSSFMRYAAVAILVYGVHYGLLWLTTELLSIPNAIAFILAQLVAYPLSFYLQRKFVFVKGSKK